MDKEKKDKPKKATFASYKNFATHVNGYDFEKAKEELRGWSMHDLNMLHIYLDRNLETLNLVREEKKPKGRVIPAQGDSE